MRKVCSSNDHYIHQDTNNTCIGNIFHVLYLCLWKLFSRNFCTYKNRNFDWFTPLHIETFQDGLNILPLTYLDLSGHTISPYFHSHNEVSMINILHVKLEGQLQFQLLAKLHVVSNHQHVIDI